MLTLEYPHRINLQGTKDLPLQARVTILDTFFFFQMDRAINQLMELAP